MDQFDARLRFLTILQNLNTKYDATPINAIKFLIKNAQYEEDLYSCIQEALQRTNDLEHRLSLFYFIESLCLDTAPDTTISSATAAGGGDAAAVSSRGESAGLQTGGDLGSTNTSRETSESLDNDLDTYGFSKTNNGGNAAGNKLGSSKRPKTHYHAWIIRDLYEIVCQVVPKLNERKDSSSKDNNGDDSSNAATQSNEKNDTRPAIDEKQLLDTSVNIKQVRFALKTFSEKHFIDDKRYQELEDMLQGRENEM